MQVRARAMIGLATMLFTLACATISAATDSAAGVGTIVAQTLTAVSAGAPVNSSTPSAAGGLPVDFPGGQLTLPAGLATGIDSETVPAALDADGAPWWGIAPEHTRLTLRGYVLQGKFHEAQLLIFPAAEYAAVNESAAENIRVLQSVSSTPGMVPESQSLPHITFFNAGPVFQAQAAALPFENGLGIRALTEYAQYAAPANNMDMFYHFQGLTADGTKYVVAILPITAPLLATDSSPSSVPPVGGVTFPDYGNPDPALFEEYYSAVTNLLNGTAPGDFSPSLADLDALIGSLSISP